MLNLKSKCCGDRITKTLTGFWNCQKCGQRCKVEEKPEEKCNCKTKYCEHYKSDFDKFIEKNPLVIKDGYADGGSTKVTPTQTDDWEKWGKDLINRFYDLYLEKGDKKGLIDYFEARTFLYNAVLTARQEERTKIREMIQLNLTQVSDATTERYIGYKECLSDLLEKLK